MRDLSRLLFLTLAPLAITAPIAAAVEPVAEYALKAAYLYNFAGFTTWPGDSGPSIQLCVLGKDPFGAALDNLTGKAVGNSRLAVRRLDSGESIRDCQILFISASEKAALTTIVDSLRGASVLTVADIPGATEQGVMIEMTLDDRRVVFSVNAEAARRARLSISSKVLRLAKAVL